MDLLSHIGNRFVSSLYASSQLEKCKLGFISLDNSDHLTLTFHMSERPKITVKKWGAWDSKFNTVVIKTICQGIIRLTFTEVTDLKKLRFDKYESRGGVNFIRFFGEDGSQAIEIEYRVLTFQNCSVYLDTSKDKQSQHPDQ